MPGVRQVLRRTTGGRPGRVSAAWLALAALALGASAARAQPPDSSFDRLAARLRSGEKVVITGAEGQVIRGKVVAVDSLTLSLDTAEGRRQFRENEVRQVNRYYRDSGWEGALLGAGAGALALWGIAAVGDPEMASDPEAAPALLVLGASGGALVGYIVDAVHKGQQTVFVHRRQGGTPVTLLLQPSLGVKVKGLRFTLAF